jgi:hypothetical protein
VDEVPSVDDDRSEGWDDPTEDDTVEGPPDLTSGATSSSPTTGWYSDPAGTGNLRWWNGTTWTSKTRPSPTAERLQGG